MDGTSVWNVLIAEGDELPGLEDSLLRTFRQANVVRQSLPDILREAVYDKWLDFFETLPRAPSRALYTTHLCTGKRQSLSSKIWIWLTTRSGNPIGVAFSTDCNAA
ncbi:cysteine protease [Colletotrichum higginsianum]|nr:cysteine protease [Colletotrichum higginsianum]